jgi:hypothetical protein
VPTIDLPDDELAAVTAAIRRVIAAGATDILRILEAKSSGR